MTSDEGSALDCVKSAEILSDVDIRMDIEKVMKMMPNRRYAEVLKLNLYYGYSAEDIAVILDTTVSNVYNIKHRAIVQFVETFKSR
jgi:DNA-directed RNA polymerase specialized sigma24 family protein